MKIYLMRHGETEWNKELRVQGQRDIPLNENGIKLAEESAEGLKEIPFEVIYSSPLIRAKKTAEIMKNDRDISIIPRDELKEISFGSWEGNRINQIKNDPTHPVYCFLRDPAHYIPTGGAESLQELYARGKLFLDTVITPLEGKYDCVLVTAHSAIIRSIINPIAGLEMKDFWKIRMENCAVSILELKNGEYHVIEAGRQYCTPTQKSWN